MTQAAPDVLSWISGRLAGTAAPTNCNETGPVPTSTATSPTGDWTVDLNSWNLGATVNLATLGSTITLPASSTFSGVADLTTNQLQNGVVQVPTFTENITALGVLPLSLTFGMVQAGPAIGTATLDAKGNLTIAASVGETFELSNISFLGINLAAAGCTTVTPVNFPLNYSGPVSSLGDGQLTFSGTTTFPQLQNCGALTAILNVLFPGTGQGYSFTVSPPAGVGY
jgi:hypothetical protein